jgi:hypothetical protein
LRTGRAAMEALVRAARKRPNLAYIHNAGDAPVAFGIRALTGAQVVTHVHLPPPRFDNQSRSTASSDTRL